MEEGGGEDGVGSLKTFVVRDIHSFLQSRTLVVPLKLAGEPKNHLVRLELLVLKHIATPALALPLEGG